MMIERQKADSAAPESSEGPAFPKSFYDPP